MTEVKRGDWDYTTGTLKPMAGLNSHIDVVVARSIDIALAILSAGTETDRSDKVLVPGSSILFIGNESGFFIFDEPFQEIWGETEIDPDCPCQQAPSREPEGKRDEAIDAEAIASRPEDPQPVAAEPAHDVPARPSPVSEPEEGESAASATDRGRPPETVQ